MRTFYRTDLLDRQERQEQFINLLEMVRAQLGRLPTSDDVTAASLEFIQQLSSQLMRPTPNVSLVKVTGASEQLLVRQLSASIVSDTGAVAGIGETALVLAKKIEWLTNNLM